MQNPASTETSEPGAGDGAPAQQRSPRALLIASLTLVVTLIACYAFWPGFREGVNEAWTVLTSGDRSRIEDWVSQFGFWGSLVIVILMIVQMFLFIAPSWLLMVIAVLAYGSFWGACIAVVAVAAASSVGYGIGHLIGEHALSRLLGARKEQQIRHETERYGIWAVVIARINPFLSNDAISIVGGMLRMGFWKFMGATLAGITPLAIAIAIFGQEWTQMKMGLLWLSILSLVGLGTKIWFDKRRDRKLEKKED